MSRLKVTLFVVVLAMMGATAGALAHARANQKLGLPGVKTAPLPGSKNLAILLPAQLDGYQSLAVPESEMVTNMLPQDTSYGQCLYTAKDGFQALANVVLMGSSRESIHKPQICLTAQGWEIDPEASRETTIHMDKPVPYDLPVMRLIASRKTELKGQPITERGLYVYWFVDADRLTSSHQKRMLWMARDVIFKNELDRWAYVAFFSICLPGQEEAAYDRMKQLIAGSVPEFQLVPPGIK